VRICQVGLVVMAMLMAAVACEAQTAAETNKAALSKSVQMGVTLRMQKKQPSSVKDAEALLYADNLSDRVLMMRFETFRIHLNGENGEPERTFWYHSLLGDPGYAPLTTTLNVSEATMVLPGRYYSQSFPLRSYYVSLPSGHYSMYMEVPDPDGVWLRTNVEEFLVVAASDNSKKYIAD
jgi:hypothetical protein